MCVCDITVVLIQVWTAKEYNPGDRWSLLFVCVHVLVQADLISANLIHTAKEDIIPSVIQLMFSITIFLSFLLFGFSFYLPWGLSIWWWTRQEIALCVCLDKCSQQCGCCCQVSPDSTYLVATVAVIDRIMYSGMSCSWVIWYSLPSQLQRSHQGEMHLSMSQVQSYSLLSQCLYVWRRSGKYYY